MKFLIDIYDNLYSININSHVFVEYIVQCALYTCKCITNMHKNFDI